MRIMNENMSYTDWVKKRKRLLGASDIRSTRRFKKGRKISNPVVCSLCGRRLSRHNFDTSVDFLKFNSIYLSTGTFLHYYICERPDTCYKHYTERRNK